MHGSAWRRAACWLMFVSAPAAAQEELPDVEFLEYLGSWEESDEEWLLFDSAVDDAVAEEELAPAEHATERDIEGAEQ